MYKDTLKNGAVKYRMPYTDVLTGKVRTVSVTMDKDTPRNRRRAEELLRDKIDEIMNETSADKVTLEYAIGLYLKEQEVTSKISTYNRNKATMNRIARMFNKGTYLNKVPVTTWKAHLMALSKGKAGTFNEYLKRLKSFLNWCYTSDLLLDRAVIDKMVRLPDESKHDKVADKYLEMEQVKVLLEGMGCEYWMLLTKFMVLSGLRVGEALALKKNDISDGYIHVTKTLNPNFQIILTPKTSDSYRDVSIQQELAECINDINQYFRYQSKRNGIHSTLLFWDIRNGGYCDYYSYNKYLKENSARLLDKEITTHVLRHTHASLLMWQDVPIDMISRRLGHSDSKITRQIYLHITELRKKKDAEKIENVRLLSI